MSLYLGIDVLDQQMHNMRDSIKHAFTRKGLLVGTGLGRRQWDDAAGQALPTRNFTWTANGRTEIAALRSFLDARKGRVVPFWTPTFGTEIVLAADAASGASTVRIHFVAYARTMFPLVARRYLAVLRPDGTFFVVKGTAATDNGDGTETLTLSGSLPETVVATRLLCYFALCRLAADLVPIRWLNPFLAEADIPFQELPLEVPA